MVKLANIRYEGLRQDPLKEKVLTLTEEVEALQKLVAVLCSLQFGKCTKCSRNDCPDVLAIRNSTYHGLCDSCYDELHDNVKGSYKEHKYAELFRSLTRE